MLIILRRWRPYRVECTGSLPTSEVKRRRARLVLGWGTAREDLRVLPAFAIAWLRCRGMHFGVKKTQGAHAIPAIFFVHFSAALALVFRWRPYRVECTGSLLTSEVKRHRARLVLGWGTAREDLRVLSAFRFVLFLVGSLARPIGRLALTPAKHQRLYLEREKA